MMSYLVRYVSFIFDMIYGKKLCNDVPMTTWGRVYYTNLLSIPYMVGLVCIRYVAVRGWWGNVGLGRTELLNSVLCPL